jgi:probable HAF family extracellular repeat protein
LTRLERALEKNLIGGILTRTIPAALRPQSEELSAMEEECHEKVSTMSLRLRAEGSEKGRAGESVMPSKIRSTFIPWTLFSIAFSIQAADQLPLQLSARHTRYELINIGTFGGPASYINPAGNGSPKNQVNSSGTAVGGSDLPIPTTALSNGFVCFGPEGVVPFVNHAFQWKDGIVSDLGALGGPEYCSVANSINDSGLIAGTSENGVIDPIFVTNEFRAVVWENGRIVDLGTFGGRESGAGAVNNKGQVVGWALTSKPDPFSLILVSIGGLGTGPQTRAFLWQKGHMRDLGTLGGLDAMAGLVNDRGQVAGVSYTNEDPNPTTGYPTLHPFLWENGKMLDLGSLGGTVGGAIAINNRGQVVGVSNLAGDQGSDLFLWDKCKLTDLTTQSIGGSLVFANAINDTGQIVGGAIFRGGEFDAAVWHKGVLTDLGTLDGDCASVAWAINSHGQIVGSSFSCDFGRHRAFLWQNGSIVDLNALIPAGSSLELTDPLTITDNGEIAGIGTVPGSGCENAYACGVAFVLQPTDKLVTVTGGATAQSGKSRTTGLGFREIMTQIESRTGRQRRLPGLAPVRGGIDQ